MRSRPFLIGLAIGLGVLASCREPVAAEYDAEVYSLIAIDGVALPIRGIASASLALSTDNLFILTHRDTAGMTSLDIGTFHWAGPFETDRVNYVLMPETGTNWHAVSFNTGDTLTLMRADQTESYRRR
jgi:hypothetical protein